LTASAIHDGLSALRSFSFSTKLISSSRSWSPVPCRTTFPTTMEAPTMPQHATTSSIDSSASIRVIQRPSTRISLAQPTRHKSSLSFQPSTMSLFRSTSSRVDFYKQSIWISYDVGESSSEESGERSLYCRFPALIVHCILFTPHNSCPHCLVFFQPKFTFIFSVTQYRCYCLKSSCPGVSQRSRLEVLSTGSEPGNGA
jgi:hypothetical protein